MLSPTRSRKSARSCRLPRAHAGAAAVAAAIAACAWAASARAYSPTTSSTFEGLMFRLASAPGIHSPATRFPWAAMACPPSRPLRRPTGAAAATSDSRVAARRGARPPGAPRTHDKPCAPAPPPRSPVAPSAAQVVKGGERVGPDHVEELVHRDRLVGRAHARRRAAVDVGGPGAAVGAAQRNDGGRAEAESRLDVVLDEPDHLVLGIGPRGVGRLVRPLPPRHLRVAGGDAIDGPAHLLAIDSHRQARVGL